MRLLVYGGNQHGERRRIGTWPEAAGPQVLRDAYGSSVWSVSYGVGVLDQNPFVILRKIENFGQRAYPLAILLDPGVETWDRFDWNGAHLLWALFGNVDSPGIRLITEPESYHSEEHLERLLGETDEGSPPRPDEQPPAEAESLLDLWSGAVLSEDPIVMPLDPGLMGFSARPDLKTLSFLLGKLPLPLRCGMGWLFGGRANHAKSLGARLVFDDSMSEPPEESQSRAVFEFQQRGAALRSALETQGADENGDSALKEYLEKPLFMWGDERMKAIAGSLDDILLLKKLKDLNNGNRIVRLDEVGELFVQVNRRRGADGALNKSIADAAYRLAESADRRLTPEETTFVLNHKGRGGVPTKLKAKLVSNMDDGAAFDYFVEHGIYPAAAASAMPEGVRARVCEKLLRCEERGESIPHIVSKEARLLPAYAEQERQAMIETAVGRSADLPGGLLAWRGVFGDEEIGEAAREAVRAAAFRRVHAGDKTSISDYLILSDDAGGRRLAQYKPAMKLREPLAQLVAFVVTNFKEREDEDLARSSEAWLKGFAETELRLNVGLDAKDEIAHLLKNGWNSYAFMRQAFRGGTPSAVPRPGGAERDFLSQELAATANEVTDPRTDFVPDLNALTELLGPDSLGRAIDSVLKLEPRLGVGAEERWVSGWWLLSESDLEERLLKSCREKFRVEYLRLLLQTDTQPLDLSALDGFEEEEMTRLFRELLWGGREDARRRGRLVDILQHRGGRGDEAFQRAYREVAQDGAKRDAFGCRFLADVDARKLISRHLGGEDKSDFEELIEATFAGVRETAVQEIVPILTSASHEPPHEQALLDVKKRVLWAGDGLFREALAGAFEVVLGDEGLKSAYLLGGASSGDSLSFCNENLPAEMKKRLKALSVEKKHMEFGRRIEGYIFGGGQDEDEPGRKALKKAVLGKVGVDVSVAIDGAVRRALSSPDAQNTMFKRFLAFPSVSLGGREKRYWVDESEPAFKALFDNLQPETRQMFLSNLWELSNRDEGWRRIDPLPETARLIFQMLKKFKDREPKPKGKKAAPEPALTRFQESVLLFLGHNQALRKQIGRWELGPGGDRLIDDYMSNYIPRRTGEDSAPPEEADEEMEVIESVYGQIIGAPRRIKNLFFRGRRGDAEQEGED